MAETAKALGELQKEMQWMKNDQILTRNAILQLEKERDSLRQAVRKLKLENVRIKDKMKTMQTELRRMGGHFGDEDTEIWNKDYDDIGRDFILVGGKSDPLSPRYEATIRDENGVEHRSSERYYWYKMAEYFGDVEAMAKIQQAASTPASEEAAKEIKGFEDSRWKEMKLYTWERGQQLKLEQVRWIQNLLVESNNQYIAVADQDKAIGTGWRKNREESNKPIFWDGENHGGRYLMKYRKQLQATHDWAGPYEQQETQKKFGELKKYVWRRIDPSKGRGGGAMGRGAPSGRGRGGKPVAPTSS